MTDQPTLDIVTRHPKAPKVSKASAEARARIAGGPETFTVPFGSLKVADNIRADDTDVATLAESIRTHGLLSPIAVRPYDNDGGSPTFVVETGHRRWHALRALKLEAGDPVPVHIISAAQPETRTVRQWVENHERAPLSPIDEANTIRVLTQLHGMRIADAAEQLGMDRNTASRRLLLLKLPEQAQRMVIDGSFELEAAQLLGRLIRDKVNPTVTNLLIGANRHTVQRAVKAHADEQEQQKFVSALEARGITVLSDPKNGPAPDGDPGYRTGPGRDLKISKVAEVKAIDLDALAGDTLVHDGSPVVWVFRHEFSGRLQTYSVELVEVLPPAAAADDGSLSQAQINLGDKAIKVLRRKQLAGVMAKGVDPQIPQVQRAVMWLAVARSLSSVVAAVADQLGLDTADLHNRVDPGGTANLWWDTLTDEQVPQVTMLATMLTAISHVGHSDLCHPTSKPLPLSPFASAVTEVLGVRGPLTFEEFRAVALKAEERTQAAAGTEAD